MRPVALLLLACTLFADSKTVTKTTVNGHDQGVETEYVQGDKRRSESSDAYFHGATIFIEHKVIYQLDFKLHQYTETQLSPPPPFPPPKRPQPVAFNGPFAKVDLYQETIDTGERKQFFGKTAQHLILRQRFVGERGSCYSSSTSEREGWYLPITEPPPSGHLGTYILSSGMVSGGVRNCLPKFIGHGHFPAVFPVVETRRDRNNFTFKREILEFSDAPLDPSLFKIPPGFKKVNAFPQPKMPPRPVEQVDWWESLKRAIWSWFS